MTIPSASARRRHRLVVILLLAAGVAIAIIVAVGLIRPVGGDSNAIAPLPPSTGTVPGQSASPSAAPRSDGTAPPSVVPFAAPGPRAPGKRTTTEVENNGGSDPVRLPPSEPRVAMFTGPVPKSASASGRLVTGFPSVIPLAHASTVASSSVASSGTIVQATLVARTTVAFGGVVDFYNKQFAKFGIAPIAVPAAAGSTAFAFTRDDDNVTLTVTPTGDGGSRYSVFGVLNAAS
ncbi:MAG: hypothetical protein QOK46_170 [Microbacteriaceae bacterium]|jgi:hypothetical protein|nr:hypothetical protein [Microbacteriaceae bacterium]